MPKSTTVAPLKRKAPATSEPDDELLGGREGDESDDDSAGLKAAFLKQYKSTQKAVPESRTIKSSGGSMPTVAVEGIVVRRFDREVGAAKLPQIAVDVVVSKVRVNGAPDILVSGTPGFDFLLPTYKPKKDASDRDANDDSPDAPAGGSGPPKKKQAIPRTLQLPASHKTVAIGVGGMIQAAMFTTANKGPAGGADKKKEGVDLVVPGMKVEVTGVVAGLASDGGALYLNTSNINAVADGIAPGHGPNEIINYLKLPEVQEGAAIRLSQAMRGFHGVELPPHLETQAQHMRRRWSEVRDGIVSAVEAKAMALRADAGADMESAALVMDDHAQRLRSTNPADLSGGAYFFTPAKNPTPDYPTFNAAIVHEIASMDFPCPAAQMSFLEGGVARDALPEVFCMPTVTKCEFTPYNSVVIAHLKLEWIGSKAAAIANLKQATQAGGVFALDSVGAAVGIKVDLRKDLPPFTGIIGVAKGVDMASDIMHYGRWAIVTGANPKEPTDYDVAAPWNDGFTLDTPATIRNIGILVDEAFIKKNLMGGGTAYAYESDPDVQVFQIKDKEGVPKPISEPKLKLRTDGYQELTSQTYKLDTAEVPPDCKGKEYRVWFKGATSAITADTSLLEDTEAGGAAVMAAAGEVKMAPLKFLLERCAVYAVAIKA
jgi:hypothetical protein